MDVILGVVGQLRQEVACGSTRKLFEELRGQHLRNFHEGAESHRLPTQVENCSLPPYRSEDRTSANVNGERSNLVRTMAP